MMNSGSISDIHPSSKHLKTSSARQPAIWNKKSSFPRCSDKATSTHPLWSAGSQPTITFLCNVLWNICGSVVKFLFTIFLLVSSLVDGNLAHLCRTWIICSKRLILVAYPILFVFLKNESTSDLYWLIYCLKQMYRVEWLKYLINLLFRAIWRSRTTSKINFVQYFSWYIFFSFFCRDLKY